jgi:tetratricopeptide (TPR) repeat protein
MPSVAAENGFSRCYPLCERDVNPKPIPESQQVCFGVETLKSIKLESCGGIQYQRTSAVCTIYLAALFVAPMLAQSYESLFEDATALSAKREFASAARKYEEALRLRPGAPEALNNLGVVYYAAGRYREAADSMARVLEFQPDLASANLILGLSLIRLNRAAEAVPPLENVLHTTPAQRDAILGLASARIALDDLASAKVLYQRLIASAPRDPEALYGMAVCNEKLAENASRALAEAPGAAALHKKLLSEYLLQRGEDRLALEALDESNDLQRREAPSADVQALYDQARELATQSRDAFLRFIDAAPDSWQAHLFLGDLNRQKRSFPEAAGHYSAVIRQEPENPAGYLGLGTVYWELGDGEKARDPLLRVLQLNPANSQAKYELGSIALRDHRDEEAVGYFEDYLRVRPDQKLALAELGKAYLHLKRFQQAAAALEKAKAVDRYGDIHFQLATALKQLGRKEEADTALRKSREIREKEQAREQRLVFGR